MNILRPILRVLATCLLGGALTATGVQAQAQPASQPTSQPTAPPAAQNAAPATDPQTGLPTAWPDPAQLEFDPVTFNEPTPERVVLSNGLVVYLLEDHSLPLIDGAAFVKTGSLYDPQAQSGLAALTADLMRSGGSAGKSADALDERLETLAASVEVSAAPEFTSATFSSLTENVDEVLGIFSGVIKAPSFAQPRIDLAKGRVLEGIRRENDDPVTVAVRELNRRIAAGHPAGYVPTADTVGAITRSDLVAFHARYFKPSATVLAISGDFERDALLERLEAAFSSWAGGAVNYPELPPYNPDPAPRVYHAQKDVGQSIVLLGHPSVYAYTPAYNELDVANAVLGGGGFTSRIFTEVRTRRGLAYSAGSQVGQGFAYPGTFLVYAFTRTDKTAEVIALLKEQMRQMAQQPVSARELEVQKNNILNGAVFRFISPAAIVQRVARATDILGLEPGYYDRYIRAVQAATPQDVQQISRREFRPQDMLIVVVGDSAQFDRPLSEFGTVEEITLPLPE